MTFGTIDHDSEFSSSKSCLSCSSMFILPDELVQLIRQSTSIDSRRRVDRAALRVSTGSAK